MVETVSDFAEKIAPLYSKSDIDLILKACETAQRLHEGQLRASGEPYFIHPLQVADILLDMGLDAVTITAALLHDTLEDTSLERETLRDQFGKDVESLVFGVTKIDIVKTKNKNAAEAETIRKMLFAMVKDIRVILIKLADRLHNMRTLQYKTPDRQKAIAQDTLDIYAPLAARLGMSSFKDELEDLSLKFLQQEIYQQIKAYLAQKKSERVDYLERIKTALVGAAKEESLEIEVHTRAKHFYSIYEKMKERNKKLEEIYDFLGIRILCSSIQDCYVLLGLVHRLWMPIEGRFKDYIAMPKSNRYQSLHTTVMGYEGKLTEIQIRTYEMEETAQFGVAAHWIYKKGDSARTQPRDDLTIISKLKALDSSSMVSSEFLEEIKKDILRDSIYVFTPKGDVIQLPHGATAIDFAYHIHTEVGHHAAAARADGTVIPLRAPLKNTQVIDIITNPQAKPNVDWLRFVKTSRTRHKIRTWLNKHDEGLIIDRSIVIRRPPQGARNEARFEAKKVPQEPTPRETQDQPRQKLGIRVGDERNMMIRFASCCNPVSGDDIVGYVSRGRGVIIHKRDCRNLANIAEIAERLIDVEWELVSPRIVRTILVVAYRNAELFGLIEAGLKRHHATLRSGNLEENHEGLMEGRFSIEMPRGGDLKKILRELKSIKTVVSVGEIFVGDGES